MFLRILTAIACVVAIPAVALADGAFSWKDASGKTHYGTTPPSNAKEITKLNSNNFSRYSSTKMVDRYKTFLDSRTANPEPEKSFRPDDLPIERIVPMVPSVAIEAGKENSPPNVSSLDIEIENNNKDEKQDSFEVTPPKNKAQKSTDKQS